GKEPSKHILQDLPAVSKELESWGGGILFLIPEDKVSPGFEASVFKGLPAQTLWSIDKQRELLKATSDALQIDLGDNFPLMIYLSDNGGILFSSTGYRIGTGEDLLKIIKLEKAQK
ncbi:MAG: transglutaminase domain-containing protein, partial [Tannerella sp.]|nr:transglutaminase domain-containing protein [Tannerella sp.]